MQEEMGWIRCDYALCIQCGGRRTQTEVPTILFMSSDFERLKQLTLSRQSLKAFSGKALENGVLEEILGYALVSLLLLLYT